jgi:hypothetical protein
VRPCETVHQAVKVPGLQRLAWHSGLIFSGTVLRVEHLNLTGAGGPAITQRTFRVQQAIRDVRAGQLVDIQEWGGLGQMGERYQPGEQVVLLLYPASRLGLTSPVGGEMGRFRVNKAGRGLLKTEDGRRAKVELKNFAATVRRTARE